jgi:hypothetical protein
LPVIKTDINHLFYQIALKKRFRKPSFFSATAFFLAIGLRLIQAICLHEFEQYFLSLRCVMNGSLQWVQTMMVPLIGMMMVILFFY